MKPFFYISAAGHAAFLTFVVVWATLFSKPRLSYYAIDMISGSPAPSATPAVETPPEETPAEPEAPAKPEPKSAIKEAIKIKEKERPKPPKATPKPTPAAPKPKPSITGALQSLAGSAPAASMPANQGQTGASITAQAGPTFPYPWYLKAISDKLDEVWKPLGEQSCQVKFVIFRDGRVSSVAISKSSGDSYFDQLAIRAVQDVSLPPLPNGYPEATLRVFMTFTAKN